MKKVYYTFVDLLRFFEMTSEMYVYSNPPKNYVKNPILIIPGLGSRWGGLKPLADFIAKSGYPVYVVKELGDNLFEIPYSAEIVKKVIEENDLRNVILVGHSKGGLIGKYLMIHDDNDKRVLGMVSLATPYSGSRLANHLIIHRWKQFSTSDPMILELQEDKSVNKRIISISPAYDTAIWHKDKSNLEDSLENITVSVSGHLNMVYKKELQETVEKSIEKISALK